ncbi:hypothetical protein AC578_7845 [Pseudocercospora eumusae]|uniref:Uncharacterized protein n=1 Tax=Pseudocercospora eumusae TaxID=321146 RepID=A0A139HJC5_9PEZI|nr:hypothetical protein AC578_7845 [Pseudocercospora eumusae]
MAAITHDDDSGSDFVVAAFRKRRRDEDEDEPVVASEEELAYLRATDRNFEVLFVRSESTGLEDTSRIVRSETFGREDEVNERPAKRQRGDYQESISDEGLYEAEPVYPFPVQVSDERVEAPAIMGGRLRRPVGNVGWQSPETFIETGFAQSPLPSLAFTSQREDKQDIDESVENNTLYSGKQEDNTEEAEARCSSPTTKHSAHLEDFATYYERVAHLARQPAVVLYVREAFINFRVHKEKHPNSRITATDVRQKLKFILEREAMVPVVQDWSSYPLPVALIRAHRAANEDESAGCRSTPESDCYMDDFGDGSGNAAYASDGFEDEESEVPESTSSGLAPSQSPASAAAEASRVRYIECARTWNTARGHTCGILHAMPWSRMEEAHLDDIIILKQRLSLQEKYDRCAAQWLIFGSHNCEVDGEDRSADDLRIMHHSKVKSMQYRRDKYERCEDFRSIFGRRSCGVEEETGTDRLQKYHLSQFPLEQHEA